MSRPCLCGFSAAFLLVVAGCGQPADPPVALGDPASAFEVFNVNGEFAGEKRCLVCAWGTSPVAIVFARQRSNAVDDLAKALDAAGERGLKSFVVHLSDDEALPAQLKTAASDLGLKHTVLTVDRAAGPQTWTLPKDAETIAVIYDRLRIKAIHPFAAGKLDRQGIETVLADANKVLKSPAAK
jgi:hypothetical protein